MKIYWTVSNKEGHHCRYFLDSPVEKIKQIAFDWKLDDLKHISVYELDTDITPKIIIGLLNGEFSHCMLNNYQSAKCIKSSEDM